MKIRGGRGCETDEECEVEGGASRTRNRALRSQRLSFDQNKRTYDGILGVRNEQTSTSVDSPFTCIILMSP